MSQSARAEVSSHATGSDGTPPVTTSSPGLREAVLAGPAHGMNVDDATRSSVLGCLAGGDWLTSALSVCGHVDRRRRVFTGEVTVQVILGLCLFIGEGYNSVLARVLPRMPGVLAPGAPIPTGSALSQARAGLAESGEPLRDLFEATARAEEPITPGSTAFGLVLTAFDGTVGDLAATGVIEDQFAVPSGGRYPRGPAGHPGHLRHPTGPRRRPGLLPDQRTGPRRGSHHVIWVRAL